MSKASKHPPEFKTEAEERAFWESHDSSEYVDWDQAQRVRRPDLKRSMQATSFDDETIRLLKAAEPPAEAADFDDEVD